MEVSVIQVGTAKAILLPQSILDEYEITDSVTLVLEENGFKIAPPKKVRVGWEAAFQQMAQNGDDALLIPDVFEDEIT